MLTGQKCPVCGNHPSIIGPAPEYKNSIWASEYKEYFSKYLTEYQMKTNLLHTNNKVEAVCPDCKNKKWISVSNLLKFGIRCICGNKRTYPNKFVYNVLKQLGLNITTEYSPQWANGKRYDDYLLDYNIIIENHGLQHYEDCFRFTHRNLQEEIENDKYKKLLAIQNNITNYIIIDCRISSLEWIKKSIMSSELIKVLNFTEDDINWNIANEYASNNYIKQAAELYNSGEKVTHIANQLGVSLSCVIKWLKKSVKFGWCDYEPSPKYTKGTI